jgi:hypothetical protein
MAKMREGQDFSNTLGGFAEGQTTRCGGKTVTSLVVSFVHKKDSGTDEEQAKEIAAVVLQASPSALGSDLLGIVVLRTAEFGFFHYSMSRSFSHTPEEWRRIISTSGARAAPTTKFPWQPRIEYAAFQEKP